MAVLLFVHVKVVPLGEPLNVFETAAPEQTDTSVGCVTEGVGLTEMEYVLLDVQPLA